MIQASLSAIIEFMRANKYEADLQKETQQAFTILKIAHRQYPLFLRLFDASQLLQLLVFIPVQIKPEIIADMGRLLHMLNKEMDLPGFCMDEMAGVIFYRLMIPITKKKIDSELLLTYLKSAENICQLFAAPIEAVGQGHATLDEILKKARENEEEQKK